MPLECSDLFESCTFSAETFAILLVHLVCMKCEQGLDETLDTEWTTLKDRVETYGDELHDVGEIQKLSTSVTGLLDWCRRTQHSFQLTRDSLDADRLAAHTKPNDALAHVAQMRTEHTECKLELEHKTLTTNEMLRLGSLHALCFLRTHLPYPLGLIHLRDLLPSFSNCALLR